MDATEICRRLINGYLRKDDARELVVDDGLRRQVEQRLQAVGLELVDHPFSSYYGARQTGDLASLETYVDHHDLHRDFCALVALLWAKLVLPRLIDMVSDEQPSEGLPGIGPPRRYTVDRGRLVAEYADRFGGKVRLDNMLFGRAVKLDYVRFTGEAKVYEASSPLETLVDHDAMIEVVQRGVLEWKALAEAAAAKAP